ncbi:LysR substrate-binding domain-containing protein [Achromobacter insolitus]|jgi:LysR family glycine cleavage system transcriptional activator|uniref:Glycine cleavage system transcriptional activator n=1 Tax=Achromobacter insolitus TaxID=217204 RepID=A0A6S7F0K4_9BURK|nr:LysR substrate-binding domain-containing protein [Achromobacter insolitus]APX73963.1 transcriptional regulator [Achromobacter insolitus]AVG38804.1 transcriptional regulator [Achromobacter insolitus]AXA69486.1 transcriptional regulator [Achromobacter insolitus]MCP1403938.1 LysR family glycine cleavage system transcriptional activator [Achromobacter insolitus]MDH3065242.1 LysR substrate-binding domain-containing protein [Achromobacter insolitus]
MADLPNHTPPLAALRAFEAVARLGSLSRAAAELHVTKSAVSHQLRALEADLGVALLRRGGTVRRAETTAAGADLLASVQQALTLLETACRNVRASARGKRRNTLNVSANPSLAAMWLAPRIGRFIELHPGIDIQVYLHASQDPAWKSQDIDLAFLHVRAMGPHIAEPGDIPLMTETVVPVCSPTLVDPAERGDPSVFLRHRWLEEKHVDSPETDWRTWSPRLGLADTDWQEPMVLSGLSTVAAAAAAGVGIALGRAPLIDEELASGRLVPLVPQLRMPGSWGYVMRIQANRPMDAALPTLVEFLAEEGRSTGAWQHQAEAAR